MIAGRSNHAGGANVVRIDGPVRVMENIVDAGSYAALRTVAGGDTVGADSFWNRADRGILLLGRRRRDSPREDGIR